VESGDLTDWDDVDDSLVSSEEGIELRKASVAKEGPRLWLRLKVTLTP
jgi:hypothetical protein